MFSQINGLFAGVNFNRHTGPAAQGIVVDDFLAEDFTSIEHGFVGDNSFPPDQ
jgi:gluconate 2-dehydrogenase alpha chain